MRERFCTKMGERGPHGKQASQKVRVAEMTTITHESSTRAHTE